MVMKQMRSQMKLIMWFVAICFVVGFGFLITGTGDSLGGRRGKWAQGIAGEVDGQVITVAQYTQARQQALEAYRQREGVEPGEAVIRQAGDEAWQRLVTQVVLAKLYRRLGITMTDDEVVSIIRNSPPRELMNDQRLYVNGQFDIARYHQLIADPQNRAFLLEYEKQIREALPRQKLQLQVAAGIRVTEAEVEDLFRDRNERVRARFIAFEMGRFFDPQAEVSADEIAAYHKAHRREFEAPERAKLTYVLIPKLASPADSAAARQRIDEVARELKAPGATFAELAQAYSDDPGSAGQGGDLGWFSDKQMVPEFERTAFSLRPGQTSAPFASQYGWHIVRVDSVKFQNGRKSVRAAHILASFKPGEETMAGLRSKAEAVAELARSDGMDTAAAEFGLQAIPTSYFPQGSYLPGLGVFPELMAFAFDEKKGAVSEALENAQALVVALVADRKKAGVQPLADVEQRVKMLVARQKAKAAALEAAGRVHAEIAGGNAIDQAARDNGLAVDSTGPVSRSDFVPKAGSQNEFFGAAFGLAAGAVSRPVQTDNGVYIIQVLQKIPADPAKFAAEREALTQQFYQQKQQQTLQQWFADVERATKIRDYRSGN